MEKALEKIGKEVENYKKELEAEKEAADKRKDQMMRKRQKEQHWEMLRWVVEFIENNQIEWLTRKEEKNSKEMEKWSTMAEEKIVKNFRLKKREKETTKN